MTMNNVTMNNDKWLAAIIAGVVMGIPSALPALGNCCILPAAVLAGLAAVFFYTRRTTDPVQTIDGVTLGAIAGVAGGILCAVESFFFKSGVDRLSMYDMPEYRLTAQAQFIQFVASNFWAFLWLLAFLVPAIVGGLIGAQLFRKPPASTTPQPQPPHHQ